MSEVTVVANLPCLGLERDQSATVELTPMIQGALDGGKLSLVVSDHLTEILTGENPDTEVPGDTITDHLSDLLNEPGDFLDVPPSTRRRKPRG